jgi:hypothetical protein
MTPSGRDLHLFLPIGSIWFGIIAVALELTALSSMLFGWQKTTIPETQTHGITMPAMEIERIEVTAAINGGHTKLRTKQVIFLPAFFLACLGLLLAVTAMSIPRRSWRHIWLGLSLNGFVLLSGCTINWW